MPAHWSPHWTRIFRAGYARGALFGISEENSDGARGKNPARHPGPKTTKTPKKEPIRHNRNARKGRNQDSRTPKKSAIERRPYCLKDRRDVAGTDPTFETACRKPGIVRPVDPRKSVLFRGFRGRGIVRRLDDIGAKLDRLTAKEGPAEAHASDGGPMAERRHS